LLLAGHNVAARSDYCRRFKRDTARWDAFMNKFALAVFTLAVSAVSASAADLAARPYTKAPAVVVAAYDWSGFYIGANGGGAWARKC
jgi:hypothetical protein